MRNELTDFEWAAIVDPRVPDTVQRPGGRLTAHNAHTNVPGAGANASVATEHEGRVQFPSPGEAFPFLLYQQSQRHPEERSCARLEGWAACTNQHPSRLAEDGSRLRMTPRFNPGSSKNPPLRASRRGFR